MSIIDQIDRVLEEYYKSFKRNDYKNADGIGKFKKYCDDNGFEENDISEEMKAPPDDCMLVDFDKNDGKNIFPLNGAFDTEKDRQIAILAILNYIYQNNTIPTKDSKDSVFKPTQKLRINLYIPNDVVAEITEKVYKPQMKCLGNFNEADLMYFFAVGYANRMPFLTSMVDAFTLDKTAAFAQNNITMTLEQWVQQNAFMRELTQK
eukprot:UN12286